MRCESREKLLKKTITQLKNLRDSAIYLYPKSYNNFHFAKEKDIKGTKV